MRGHARRVAFYAGLLIADRLQTCPAEDQAQMRITAFVHDIGKVGVPTELLLRAGALHPLRAHCRRSSTRKSAARLREAPRSCPTSVATAIRHHHEWWDGSGLSRRTGRRGDPADRRANHRGGRRLRRDELRSPAVPQRRWSRAAVLDRARPLRRRPVRPERGAKEFLAILEPPGSATGIPERARRRNPRHHRVPRAMARA